MYRFFQRTTLFIVGVTMPIAGFATSVGGYPMTPAKIATFLLLILVGLKFALTNDRRFPRDRGYIPLIVFTVSLAISSVVSVAHGMAPWVVVTASTRFLGLIAFYLMLVYVIRTREDLTLLLWALVIGGAVTSFPGVVEIREGTYLSTGYRTDGLAGKSNRLGFEVAICLPLAFSLYFTNRSQVRRLVLLGLVSVMMIAVVGSLSRASFVAIGAMWVFWIWRSRRVDTLKYMVPGLAVAVVLFFVMPTQVLDRVDTMLDPTKRDQDRSMNSRIGQAYWAGKAVLASPLVGIGVNNYIFWVQRQPGGAMYYNEMHSAYLYILATQGLLGFIPFMVLILLAWTDYGAAQRLVRSRRSRGDPALNQLGTHALFLQIALAGALIGAIVHPMADSKGWWMLFGISAVAVALVRQRVAELDAAVAPATPEAPLSTGFDYPPGIPAPSR